MIYNYDGIDYELPNIESVRDKFTSDKFGLMIDKYLNAGHKKTGFNNLDDIIKGIVPGLYTIGAGTGVGKSTIALQISDYMAKAGNTVLYFNLEMSNFEMLCRSLSRLAYQRKIGELTVKDIMYNNEPSELLYSTLDYYREYIGNNIYMVEGKFDMDVGTISATVKSFIDKGLKPVVFIDYLQVIKPMIQAKDARMSIDFNMTALKRLSRDLFIPIFLISSFNRSSYDKGPGLESFKESGIIEYTSDVVITLSCPTLDKDDYSKSDYMNEVSRIKSLQEYSYKYYGKRYIEATILKNRFGTRGNVLFEYYPKANMFEESSENITSLLMSFMV